MTRSEEADPLVSRMEPTAPIRQLLIIAVPPALLATIVLWFLVGWPAIIAGILIGAGVAWLFASRSDEAVLSQIGGDPATVDDASRLLNVVDGLSLNAGFTPTEVRVLDLPTVNAAAGGRPGGRTALIVTRGMLEHLDRIELEGVVAHLLVRLRSADQETRTMAATTTAIHRYLQERFAGARGTGPHDPTITALMRIDREAVRITRYPPGLLRALEAAVEHGSTIDDAGPFTSQFWFAPVDGAAADLQVRVDALREL